MSYNQQINIRSIINIPLTEYDPTVTNMIINDFDKMLSKFPNILVGIENDSIYNKTFCKRIIDSVNANTFDKGTRHVSAVYVISEAVFANTILRGEIRDLVTKYGLTLRLIEINHDKLTFLSKDICINKGSVGISDSIDYSYSDIELFNNGMRTIGYYNQDNEFTTSEITKFMIDGFNYYDDNSLILSLED